MSKNLKSEKLVINGITYIPEETLLKKETKKVYKKGKRPFVMVRTYSAGVHCGILKERKGKEVILLNSIRIWKWSGAASLSQLSMEGTNKPNDCKFGMTITTDLLLTEAIEVIEMTLIAQESIKNVTPWKS